ncbi:MAG: carboxypeptidase-like regulatory domain-containing protein, partial [Chitinophagaceae bacterium]
MQRILFMLIPVLVIMLAFQPLSFHSVSGKITDDKGSPLVSVSIVVKGTNLGALSAQDGTYQLSVTDKNAVLVFSAVGYKTQEVKIKGRATINVSLKTLEAKLEEVVVIGYGQRRKMEKT